MITGDGKICTLAIDIRYLDVDSRYWDSLVCKYRIVYVERYKEDAQVLFWERENGMAVTHALPPSEEDLAKDILKTVSDLTETACGQICFITSDRDLIQAFLSLPCVCFGTGEALSFSDAHRLPDYYLEDEGILIDTLATERYYFPGEAAVRDKTSVFLPGASELTANGIRMPLYFCGRYFGKGHFQYTADPYSVCLRKVMDKEPVSPFIRRMAAYVSAQICEKEGIDAVLSVPPKPGCISKLKDTAEEISGLCGIENMDAALFCAKDYPPLSLLGRTERHKAVSGVFCVRKGYSYDKTFLLLDDVTSSVATFEEAAQTLLLAGARKVVLLALAVVQIPIGRSME